MRARARHLLAPLCRRFTEGADTTDVRAARELLRRSSLPAARFSPALVLALAGSAAT